MDFTKIALKNKILEINVGSELFGTSTADSDVDRLGIFFPPEEVVYGFQRCEEVDLSIEYKDETGRNTAEAVDRKFHEYRKFVRLAAQCNPNILHTLFVNSKNILYINEFGNRLLQRRRQFVHKGAHHRFVKYAHSQLHKMRIKPENYARLEQGLEILRNAPDTAVMAELKDTPPFVNLGKHSRHVRLGDINIEVGVYAKKARHMVEERMSKASSRVHMFTRFGYDCKFASNLIQLLLEGIELMETGKIQFPLVYAPNILDVKAGKFAAEEIVDWAEELTERARVAYEQSGLPTEPDMQKIEQFVINEVQEFLHG